MSQELGRDVEIHTYEDEGHVEAEITIQTSSNTEIAMTIFQNRNFSIYEKEIDSEAPFVKYYPDKVVRDEWPDPPEDFCIDYITDV